jgi:hypothetical protein
MRRPIGAAITFCVGYPTSCQTELGITYHEPSGLAVFPVTFTVHPGWLLPEQDSPTRWSAHPILKIIVTRHISARCSNTPHADI